MSSNFQYLPLSPDPLPGKSFEEQTELAINEIANRVEAVENNPKIDEALNTANQALSMATEALETANTAETSAATANDTANQALAQSNDNAAEIINMNIKLDNTYDISTTAKSTADNALQVANSASDTANTALSTAQTASGKADTAISSAEASLQIANKALYYTTVNNVDLNDLYISANWYIDDSISLNLPIATKGFLAVKSDTDNTKVQQNYYSINNEIYSRSGTLSDIGNTITVSWGSWEKSSGDLGEFLTKDGLTLLDNSYIPSQPQGISTKKYVDDRFNNQVSVLPPATLYMTTTNLTTTKPATNISRPILLNGTTPAVITSTYTFPQNGFVAKESKYNLELYFTNMSTSSTIYTIVAKWAVKGITVFTQTEVYKPSISNYESLFMYISSTVLTENISYVNGDTATLTLTISKDTGGNSTINLASNVTGNQYSTINREGTTIYTTSILDEYNGKIQTQWEINRELAFWLARKPSTAYEVGDIAYSPLLPSWARLECVVAGTTASTELVLPSNLSGGGYLADGACKWIIDDIRLQLTVGEVKGMMYVPSGCVKIAGATVQRNDYIRLVNLANKYSLWTTDTVNNPGKFGVGNGSTTMVLPDWRGVVRRFLDEGKGYDVNRVLGSFQGDAIRNLTGCVSYADTWSDYASGGISGSLKIRQSESRRIWPTAYYKEEAWFELELNAAQQVPTAPENRMRNIAEMAVMRY